MKLVLLIFALATGISAEASQHLKCIEQAESGSRIIVEIEYGKKTGDHAVATIANTLTNEIIEQMVVSVEMDSSGYAPVYVVRNFEWDPRLDMTLTAAGGREYVGPTTLVMDGSKREFTARCEEFSLPQQ